MHSQLVDLSGTYDTPIGYEKFREPMDTHYTVMIMNQNPKL
ncbi:hypothetical protein BVRB_4g073580 [Beta vulgaris subsp. vulgaris]|nr:hypothetical protein BVRB_4g073580 [Beta vulgaris subsp. vulgaris]